MEQYGCRDIVGQVTNDADGLFICQLAEVKTECIGIKYVQLAGSFATAFQRFDQIPVELNDRQFPGCRQQGQGDGTLARANFHQLLTGTWPDCGNNFSDNAGIMQKILAEPFPWTVIQGVILVLVIINSQL